MRAWALSDPEDLCHAESESCELEHFYNNSPIL
jgi:hypothetical protein